MQIEEHVALAPLTTLGIGGPARFLCRVTSESELLEAVDLATRRDLPLWVLGGGSNVVVPDAGFAGAVVQVAIADAALNADGLHRVAAGVEWDGFVRDVCALGISGVECLAGIPGLVGGTPVQNVGAYGQEVASTIRTVRALDLDLGMFVELDRDECGFGYRRSIFNSTQRNRYIVTRVDFEFDRRARPNLSYADLAPLRGTDPTPLDVYRFVRAIRDRKGMLIDPSEPRPDSRSAGSFFKNPVIAADILERIAGALSLEPGQIPHWPAADGKVKLAAAWLIERAGFSKGFALGRAGISSRHTLALINRTGDATCAELMHLRDTIMAEVARRFGVSLEQEPVMLE